MAEPCILVVEPDILVRSPLAAFLRDCGYRVLEAMDAADAREILGTHAADVDIVIVDTALPDGSGFTLAQHVRATAPGIDVLLAGTVRRACELAGALCNEGPGAAKHYDHHALRTEIGRLLAARARGERPG